MPSRVWLGLVRSSKKSEPAQDPDQPEGEILRLTLDGKPASGHPLLSQSRAPTIPLS